MGALDLATLLSPLAPVRPSASDAASVAPPSPLALMQSIVRLHDRLTKARVLWFSTTRPDGRPHVVPTWFDWDGESITVFARPHAQKVRNVRHQPLVMLAIGEADPHFEVELLEGVARVVESPVPDGRGLRPSTRFAAKYAEALDANGQSLDAFAAEFAVALRVRPTRLLDFGARSAGRRPAPSPRGHGADPFDSDRPRSAQIFDPIALPTAELPSAAASPPDLRLDRTTDGRTA
jgi:PPOX class probable F420-dependent enzyme